MAYSGNRSDKVVTVPIGNCPKSLFGLSGTVQWLCPGHSCPGCGGWSARVHSSHLRFPVDGPVGGRRVGLTLRVRRFVRGNPSRGRRTFVEQIAGLTRHHGRWTERLRAVLASVGPATAGRAGSRLAGVFGVSVSRRTVLRMVEELPDP
ncbi:transposase family protein [Kitasatospora sp. NPDC001540]|uniref:transposase family protein n=1 Tax=Kitasatospora sp. NPDC001540 TaxID=3364014 RepID=UPI0036AF8725